MKDSFWKVVARCGLALTVMSGELSADDASAEETQEAQLAQAGRGGQRGGRGGGQQGRSGNQQSRGGGRQGGGITRGPSRGAGGGGQRASSRTRAGVGGKVGVHAPSFAGPRSSSARGGHPSAANRYPSFSRPPVRTGTNHNSGNQRNNRLSQRSVRSSSSANIRNINRSINRNTTAFQRRNNQSTATARIGSQPFPGNSIRLNNRSFNIGSSLYKPSHYRHNSYHGYWNGNRHQSTTGNVLNAIAYGLGSGYGYGNYGYGNNTYANRYRNYSGYGNGWGWGLGSRSVARGGYRSYSGYGYRPLGWGLGGWGLGSLNYSSGYLGYTNPYYLNSGTTVYNYTQPIPVSYNVTPDVVSKSDTYVSPSELVLSNGLEAFQLNDYDKALDIVNKGITLYSDDAVLHEFRALVLFAKQDYQQAAATIHSVLAVGPGWDWTTMSGMYSDVDLYTEQFRALEGAAKSHPDDAASQFLLGYHYMTCGHSDAAARRFQDVVALLPTDRVAVDLLRMISPTEASAEESDGNPVSLASSPRPVGQAAEEDVEPINPEAIVGLWTSSRDDGAEFKLHLFGGDKFTWSFTPKNQASQKFDGTYTVDQNVLVLERTSGGSLIAEITPAESGNFNFRLLGASDDDKGLDFSKSQSSTL